MALPRQRGLTEQAADAAIDTACRMLRQPSIRKEFSDIAERALKEQMSYRGFLAELLIDELGNMELDRHGAELLFQVLTEREEKNSVAKVHRPSHQPPTPPRAVAGISAPTAA